MSSPKCANCGRKLVAKRLPKYEAGPILGMRSVTIENLPALVCVNTRCKEKSIVIDGAFLDKMHESLLMTVLTHGHILCGEEVRFIRKALELSQAEFADRLGVHRVTVARWETGETPLDGPTSVAVRALAAMPVMVAPAHAHDKKLLKESFEKPMSVKVPQGGYHLDLNAG